MANIDVTLVLDVVRIGSVVEGGKFLDVLVAHVDTFHQRVTANDARVQRRQEVNGFLKLPPSTVVSLRATDLIKHLLVWSVHRNVELRRQRVQPFQDLWQRAVGHQHGGHAVLVTEVHVLAKTGVQRRFSVERNRHMLRVLSVQPLFTRDLGIAPKSRQQAALRSNGFVEKFLGVLVAQLHRVHVRFSPTIGAGQVALVNDRRHLHAVVAGNAVELAFVALPVPQERFLGPVAGLDATVIANDVVPLLLQNRLQLRVHRSHASRSCSLVPRSASRLGMGSDIRHRRLRTYQISVAGQDSLKHSINFL